MSASCKSNTIDIGTGQESTIIKFSKETVALVVVCCDLFIAFWLWTSLLALQYYHKRVDDDVNSGTLGANHFSVVMEQDPHEDHINDLKGIYWAWGEQILRNEPDEDYKTARGEVDENQNKIFNVNCGLSNLEYLGL